MSEALTQEDSASGLMVEPVQAQRLARSEVRAPQGRCVKGSENSSEAREFTLARKGANANHTGARTANRRRWARRES